MKIKNVIGTILAVGILATSQYAQAHLTYSGRDFGSYSGLTNGTFSITNQTCTGNYGWADAADGVLGDTHKGRAFRFHLDHAALVGGLTPAYSIYAGLGHVAPFPESQTGLPTSPDYDFCAASVVWRAAWEQQNIGGMGDTNNLVTDGCWNAIGTWKMGGDGTLPGDFSQLSTFSYIGSAASIVSGGTVAKSFALPAGDYTIMIGGNDLANKTAGTAASGFGISATLVVSPTPTLSIAQKVFVEWPSGTATNWVLQSSTNVNGPTWSSVTNAPVTVDGQPGVVLDRNASQQFFRFNYVP